MPITYVICSEKDKCDRKDCPRKVAGPTVVGPGPRECFYFGREIYLFPVDDGAKRDPNDAFMMRKVRLK